jgi:hypothetical protein
VPTPEEIAALALQGAGEEAPLNPVLDNPAARAIRALNDFALAMGPTSGERRDMAPESTNLMGPGQDPASYDLNNPTHPQLNDRQSYPGMASGAGLLPPEQPPADVRVGIDRIGAVQDDGTLDPDIDVPYDPRFVKQAPGVPTSVGGAYAQENAALGEAGYQSERAAVLKHRATQDTAERIAQSYEKAALEQGNIIQMHQAARSMAHAKADAETASWIQELEIHAQKEPNPGRWFESRSRLGKILWGLGLVAGSVNAAITPGARNAVLDMVRQEIQNDVDEQKQRMARESAILQLKGGTMRERHTRNQSDLRDDHTMAMTRLQALERAWAARAARPGDADAEAARAEVMAEFSGWKLQVAQRRTAETRQSYEAQLNRGFQREQQAAAQRFQATQADLTRQHQSKENALDRQNRLDLAPVSIQASGAGSKRNPIGKDGKPTYFEVQSGVEGGRVSGLVLKGPDGKPANGDGVLMVGDDKMGKEAADVAMMANKRYTASKDLLTLLNSKGDDDWAKMFAAGVLDPKMNALIQDLGYSIAKSHDARITNQDFNSGVAQLMGFNPNGDWLERGKAASHVADIKKKLAEDIASMPKHVSNSLIPFNNGGINGQGTQLVWDPQYLTQGKPVEKNALESGDPTAQENAHPKVELEKYTAKQYREAKATEMTDPSQRGFKVPKHDEAAVEHIIEFAKGRGPEAIRAEAMRTLDALQKTRAEATDEWNPDRPKVDVEALNNTWRMVHSIGEDEAKRAEKALDSLKKHIEGLPFDPSEKTIRELAQKRYKLTDAEGDVQEVIKEVNRHRGDKKEKFRGIPTPTRDPHE